MSALPIIITTAGLNAMPNAQNTGVSNVVIASLGVSPTQIAATAATTAIPGEVKRIAGVAGQVVADDQIYISAADQTQDTYVVRTIGLYLDTGVLFAVYSQAAPLLEKAGPAMAVLEAAIKLSTPQADAIEFSGGGWLNPQASETVQGVLRLATEAEAKAGTNATRAVTPAGLKGTIDVVVAWINQEFNGIAQALAGKAAVAHTHVMGDITGLVAALASKAAAAHTHVLGDITGLVDALNGKAAAIHNHAMSSIDGLSQALAGKAASIHTHLMGDITGLAEALAGKAAAAHTHVMSEINGLAAALNVKASLGANANFGDVRATRGGRTGVLYFGDNDDYLLFTSGTFATNQPFNAPTVSSGGFPTWHSGNFNPGLKADYNTWTEPSAATTVAGNKAFLSTGTSMGDGGATAALEVRGAAGGPAMLALHRPSSLATFFGLDVDNVLKLGGYSYGATRYRIWHEGTDDRVGQLGLFPLASAPAGWLKANGAEVSRATYAALYARIGDTFGPGNSATTFNLPDWRGEFFRGWDDGRGIDPGRALNSAQASQNLSHTHSLPVRSNANSGNSFVEDADNTGATGFAETYASGGDEARPRNVALLACIKF